MKKIIIFCANGLGELVLNSLDDEKIEVIAFADNDKDKWGKYQARIQIVAPDQIKEMEYDYIIIAYAVYASEIRKQLLNLGVEEEKIVVFQDSYKDIEWHDSRIALMRKYVDIIDERKLTGNIAEVGVFRGDFARLLNKYMPSKSLYLFDTFEGFPCEDLKNEEKIDKKEHLFKDTSEEYVLSRMPHPEKCIIKKGYFPKTAEKIADTFCFVSLDTDLYKPIKDGLEFFYPKMVKGGVIFVHDFGTQDWNGVKEAVYEFSEEYSVSFFPLLDRAESVVFVK